ncbi:hypothetical protein Tco_0845395 [Tanacetum coccineum]
MKKYEETNSDILYTVSIKEDMAYLCLHFTKDHRGNKINTPYPEKINTPYSSYGNKIFMKISNVVPTSRNPRYDSSYLGLSKKYRLSLKNDMLPRDKFEEEKACRRGKVYNWETAKYGKIWYDEDVHYLRSVETKFPSIVFKDELSSEKTLSCEPTVSSLNNNEIDFRISFDESDDEDYTVIFDKNSFSYKIIYVNDLKLDLENDNEKVNVPSFPSPEPKVSCFDDLDFFKYFENEFPAIVYNDALTFKSDQLTEPTLIPQHIDEFDLKDETSLSKYDKVEQNILYFNDLFPFNIIYPDDLKSDKDNNDDKIDIIRSSGGNVNTQGSNKLLEASHDKINKVFIMEDFIIELNVNIVAWNYLINGMLFNLIKNLYVLFGISFDPKRYYKDGVYTRMLQRPSFLMLFGVTVALIDVNAALSKLVLLENFNENYSKCLRLLVKLQYRLSGEVTNCQYTEVIENGATLPKTVVVKCVEKVMPSTSVEDKAQRRLEVKARSAYDSNEATVDDYEQQQDDMDSMSRSRSYE